MVFVVGEERPAVCLADLTPKELCCGEEDSSLPFEVTKQDATEPGRILLGSPSPSTIAQRFVGCSMALMLLDRCPRPDYIAPQSWSQIYSGYQVWLRQRFKSVEALYFEKSKVTYALGLICVGQELRCSSIQLAI